MSTSQLPAAEQEIVAAVSGDTLMDYTGTIAQWVRLSGSDEERRAFDYVEEQCRAAGASSSICPAWARTPTYRTSSSRSIG